MDPTATLAAIQSWSLTDRLALVFRVWDEITAAPGWSPPWSPGLKAELDQRWAAYQADPTRGLSWDEVEARVRRTR